MTTSPVLAVRVHRASKTFNTTRQALKGVSFDVRPGERVALAGRFGLGQINAVARAVRA
jgi:ABC-type multidrug transport system ATPase subunit